MAQPLPTPTPLPSPPSDGITSLSYLRSSTAANDLLACTSWDGTLRIYDAHTKSDLVKKSFDIPLLSLATNTNGNTNNTVYCGGIDGSIFKFDMEADVVTTIGSHNDDDPMKRAVSCLHVVDENTLASAGWDGTFQLWDVRSNNNNTSIASLELPSKAFAMDISSQTSMAVVSTSSRHNVFIDLRHIASPAVLLNRESSLKYQTRCIQFLPKGEGVAVGSIEGHVAIEYLDELLLLSKDDYPQLFTTGKKKYAFKCHRINDTIYPVNTIAFHPQYGTFATGGADGSIVTWDGNVKKKICTVCKLPTSIACVAFNKDGSQLAVACSYTFEEGERDHPREEIYVRDVLGGEVMPKSK
eukprot:scaffold4616_cov29-Cyclotella_meneghiniana.AAC.1